MASVKKFKKKKRKLLPAEKFGNIFNFEKEFKRKGLFLQFY